MNGKFSFEFRTLPTSHRSSWVVLPHQPHAHIAVGQHWLPTLAGKKECFACPANWCEPCALCGYAAYTSHEELEQRFAVATRYFLHAMALDDDGAQVRAVLTMTDVAWRAFGPVLDDGQVVADRRRIVVRPAKNESNGVWWNVSAEDPVALDHEPGPLELWRTVRQTTTAESMEHLVDQLESGIISPTAKAVPAVGAHAW